MTHTHLRPARPDDVHRIVEIHRTSRAASMPWLPVLHSLAGDIRHFRTQVLANHQVCIAELEQRPIGFSATRNGWLEHLYIAPDMLRRGVGTLLLADAQTTNDALQLWTFQRNHPARQFYARHGFTEAEQTDGAGNEEREPDIRLVWQRLTRA